MASTQVAASPSSASSLPGFAPQRSGGSASNASSSPSGRLSCSSSTESGRVRSRSASASSRRTSAASVRPLSSRGLPPDSPVALALQGRSQASRPSVSSAQSESSSKRRSTVTMLGPEEAARFVLSTVRQYPGISMSLQLEPGASDKRLLQGLAGLSGRPSALDEFLRDEGCPEEVRTQTCMALHVALKASILNARAPFWTTRRKGLCSAFAILAEVALLSAILVLCVRTAKWHTGRCKLLDFYAAQCAADAECEFDVSVVDESDSGSSYHKRWTPTSTYSYMWRRYAWDGEPFRCCDDRFRSERRSCCGLINERGDMCDNWQGSFDGGGAACPTGHWPCRFQLQVVDGIEEVGLLEVHDPPPIGALAAAACAVPAILAAAWTQWWFCGRRRRDDAQELLEERNASGELRQTAAVAWNESDEPDRKQSSRVESIREMPSILERAAKSEEAAGAPAPVKSEPRRSIEEANGEYTAPNAPLDCTPRGPEFPKSMTANARSEQLRPILPGKSARSARGTPQASRSTASACHKGGQALPATVGPRGVAR